MIDIDVKVEISGNVSEYQLYIKNVFVSNAYLTVENYLNYDDMDNVIKTLITNNIDYFRKLTVDEFLSVRNFFYGYQKLDIAKFVFEDL